MAKKPKRPKQSASAEAWIKFDARYQAWKSRNEKKEKLVKKYAAHY